jgi:hypothetical protein
MSSPEAAILKLPGELLLDIANEVDVIALKGLSLTCRRTRPIAQESLVRKATLSPINVWKLVETLRSRPGLAMALTHLRLGPITQVQYDHMMDTSEAHKIWKDHGSCCDIVSELYPSKDEPSSEYTEARVSDFYSTGMVALVALAKGMETISTGTDAIDTLPLMKTLFQVYNESESCWIEQVRSQLEGRLEELNVVIDPWMEKHLMRCRMSVCGSYTHSAMNISCFGRLKRLVIPYRKLDCVSNNLHQYQQGFLMWTMDPTLVLPHSLESISLTNLDVFFDVAWLSKLLGCFNIFPNLRKIETQFYYNMLSTAWYIRTLPQGGQKFLTLLHELKASNALFTTAFGDVKFADLGRNMMFSASNNYVAGDLLSAFEKCLATTHDDLEKDPEMLSALGYTARSTG